MQLLRLFLLRGTHSSNEVSLLVVGYFGKTISISLQLEEMLTSNKHWVTIRMCKTHKVWAEPGASCATRKVQFYRSSISILTYYRTSPQQGSNQTFGQQLNLQGKSVPMTIPYGRQRDPHTNVNQVSEAVLQADEVGVNQHRQ